MKHVFLIVNNINKIISEIVVRELGLSHNDVLFLYRREGIEDTVYNKKLLFREIRFVSLVDKNIIRFFVSLFIYKFYSLKNIDRYIISLTEDESFEVYSPHVYQDDLSAISSHVLCKKINIVEEGDASYHKCEFYDPLKKIVRRNRKDRLLLVNFFSLKNRIGGFRFFPKESELSKAFSISNKAFPFYKDKKNVLPFLHGFNGGQRKDDSYGSVFLIDPYVQLGKIKKYEYLIGLNSFIKHHIKKLSDTCLISLHPTLRNNKLFIEEILSIFSALGVTVEIFEGNLERLICSNEGFVMYSLVSSSMRYGIILGCDVVSWFPYLPEGSFINEKDKENLLYLYQDLSIEI